MSDDKNPKKTKSSKAKRKPVKKGRPRKAEKKIDLAQAEVFGKMKATHDTMADHYGVDVSTIDRKMMDPSNPFCRAYKKGFSALKLRLSEAQIRNAIDNNNATLQIWLGKQYLGQTDKVETKSESNFNFNILENEVGL